MKNQMSYIAMGTLLFTSSVAFGQAGSRGGGGEVVQTSKGLQLRDVVDRDTCTWTSGMEVFTQYPKIAEALNAVKELHWYFGFGIEREMKSIDFCFTPATLKRPASLSEDPEALPYYKSPAPDSQVVGLRLFESKAVYVNLELLNQLEPKQQALFFIHETMHSFLNPDLAARNDKLRNVVKAIRDIWDHLPMGKTTFATILKRNEVNFVNESSPLLEKKFLEYALSADETRRSLILNNQVNAGFLLKPRSFNFTQFLNASDSEYVMNISNSLVENFFGNFCRVRDAEVITKLESQASDLFDIDELCLRYSDLNETSSLQKSLVEKALNKSIDKTAQKLSQLKAWLSYNRITVSKDIELVAGNPDISTRSRIILEVNPLTSPGSTPSTQAQNLFDLVIRAAKLMPQDEWLKAVTANGALKNALNPVALKQSIDAIPGGIDREKQYAKDQIDTLYTAFKIALVKAVREQLPLESADRYADALEANLLTK